MTVHFLENSEEYELAEVECPYCRKFVVRANTQDCLECEEVIDACGDCLNEHHHKEHSGNEPEPPKSAWLEYERRKKLLGNDLDPGEYQKRLNEIADELGI